MSRITTPNFESAPAASKPLLDGVHKKLGVVPNMFRVIALSPAALEGYLGFNGALSKALDVRTRERIAIAVAEANGCDYCLSAHTYLALNLAKITAEDAEAAGGFFDRRQSCGGGSFRGSGGEKPGRRRRR